MATNQATTQTEDRRNDEIKYARANMRDLGTCGKCGGTFAIGYAVLDWHNRYCKTCRTGTGYYS